MPPDVEKFGSSGTWFCNFFSQDSLIFLRARHGLELAKLVIRCVDRTIWPPTTISWRWSACIRRFRSIDCIGAHHVLLDRVAVVTSITQVRRNRNQNRRRLRRRTPLVCHKANWRGCTLFYRPDKTSLTALPSQAVAPAVITVFFDVHQISVAKAAGPTMANA